MWWGHVSNYDQVSSVVAPILSANIRNSELIKSKGFVYATRAAAGICLVLLSASVALMRTRLPPKHKRPDANEPRPSIAGFLKETQYVLMLIA